MGRLRVDRICGPPGALVTDGGRVVAGRLYRATSRRARLVGLLGTADLAGDEALWLEPCSSVHMAGMRIPVAVAFLDSDGRLIRVVDPLRPWRAASTRGARTVVEAPPGRLAGLSLGTRLLVRS